MLRVEVSEAGQGPLPAIDVGDATFVIGSAPSARVRLPADAAHAEHVVIDNGRWLTVDGASGDIGDGIELEIGTYRVRIAPAPAGSLASPPQRTESIARELMRSLLGSGAAPSLEIERGPTPGATKKLAPPESVLVIGRGDEANWILVDEDLSRTHAEIRRGWDGTRILDLGSKNGTKVDGVPAAAGGTPLRDGALVELGKVALRFRDPADKQLALRPPASTIVATPSAARKAPVVSRAAPAPLVKSRASVVPFYAAVSIAVAALIGLVWVLSL